MFPIFFNKNVTPIPPIDKGGLKLCQFNTKVESLKLACVKRLNNR